MVTWKDIFLLRITESCPEQYIAVDRKGTTVGYIRVRWGYIDVYCPDDESDQVVYSARIHGHLTGYLTPEERRIHLKKAKKKIACWVNQHDSAREQLQKVSISDGKFKEKSVRGEENRQRRREELYQKAALPISVIALLLVLLKLFHGDMPM